MLSMYICTIEIADLREEIPTLKGGGLPLLHTYNWPLESINQDY